MVKHLTGGGKINSQKIVLTFGGIIVVQKFNADEYIEKYAEDYNDYINHIDTGSLLKEIQKRGIKYN